MRLSAHEESEKLFEEGVALYEQERFPEAEANFIKALELNAGSDEIKYNLALVYFEQQKYDLTWALVDQIHEMDCTEILEVLEKSGFKEHYDIPDDIPDSCSLCDYFKTGSMIKDDGGFCGFYSIRVIPTSKCVAFRLADEGKVSLDDVEKNQNKKLMTSIEKFKLSLNDDRLPAEFPCSRCGLRNQLTETDRVTKSFACSKCNTVNDVKRMIMEVENHIRSISETELFRILIFEQDYKPEFSLAAKREINRRGLDIVDNSEFLKLLKHGRPSQ